MAKGPNIDHVKSVTVVELYDSDTDQVVCFTTKGRTLTTAVSIADGTEKLWASILREAADQLETGVPVAGEDILPTKN